MSRWHDKLGRLRILLWREFIELRRDRFSLSIFMFIPVLQMSLLAYAITTDFDHLPLCVLDRAHTRESRQLLTDIAATQYFALTSLDDVHEVSPALGSEHCRAALLIPADFSELLANREEVRLGLLLDASDTTLAIGTEGFLTAISRAFYARVRLERLPLDGRHGQASNAGRVTVRQRVLFNPTLSGTAYMIPGLLGIICLFLTVLITSLALVRERDAGTLEQLLVTPVTTTEVVLGKILPFGAVAMVAVIVCILSGWLVFGIFPTGSLLLLLAVTPMFLLTGLSMGLLVSSLAQSSVDALERSILIMVPQMMLSGLIFSLSLMYLPFRVIGEFVPLTHYLRITRGIYMKGQGFAELWSEVAILGVFLVVLVTRAARAIKKQA